MLASMKRYDLFVNGQSVPAADGRTFRTINPADTRETVAEYAVGGAADVTAAVAAAEGGVPEMGRPDSGGARTHPGQGVAAHRGA
jgi:acyl-CoA reductase-like NAD-dependent aldehyde dehydrogenase